MINDTSKTNELDTIIINGQKLGNLDSVLIDESKWQIDTYGYHSKGGIFENHVGIGINSAQNSMMTVNNSYFSRGIDVYNTEGIGVAANGTKNATTGLYGQCTHGSGVYGHSVDDGIGVEGTTNNGYSGVFWGGLGLWTSQLTIFEGSWPNKTKLYSLPESDGDSLSFIRTDGHGQLSFSAPDTSLWSISSTGIKSKTKAVAINSEIVDSYNLAIKADGSDNTLGLWNSGTGNILEGRNYLGASVFNVDKDGKTTTTGLTVGSGSTITRSGTMATYDKWTGTQAEWTANTPKDGVYPQASTTFWTIKD